VKAPYPLRDKSIIDASSDNWDTDWEKEESLFGDLVYLVEVIILYHMIHRATMRNEALVV